MNGRKKLDSAPPPNLRHARKPSRAKTSLKRRFANSWQGGRAALGRLALASHRSRAALLIPLFITVVGVAAGRYGLLRSSFFATTTVRIAGLERLERSAVLLAADLRLGMPLLTLSTRAVERRLLQLTDLAEVNVQLHLPNTVSIRVVEHKPIARIRVDRLELWSALRRLAAATEVPNELPPGRSARTARTRRATGWIGARMPTEGPLSQARPLPSIRVDARLLRMPWRGPQELTLTDNGNVLAQPLQRSGVGPPLPRLELTLGEVINPLEIRQSLQQALTALRLVDAHHLHALPLQKIDIHPQGNLTLIAANIPIHIGKALTSQRLEEIQSALLEAKRRGWRIAALFANHRLHPRRIVAQLAATSPTNRSEDPAQIRF